MGITMSNYSENLKSVVQFTPASTIAGELPQNLPYSHISLKQWNTLLAVVRNGSFARAAEELHITQPAISYTIAKIEERLGMSLLRPEGRRAKVTNIGLEVLAHVEALVQHAAQVEFIVRQLRASWRPEIRLAVVDEFPISMLLSAIRSYSDTHSNATVLVTKGTPDMVCQLLQSRKATLGIVQTVPSGMHADVLVETEYVPVAHTEHPLFLLGRPLADADFQRFIEVKVGAEGGPGCHDACSNESPKKLWKLSNVDAAEKALVEGVGYGWLSRHQVQASLDAGRLAVLPTSANPRRTSLFYLGYHVSETPDIEAGKLIVSLHAAAEQCFSSVAEGHAAYKRKVTEGGL